MIDGVDGEAGRGACSRLLKGGGAFEGSGRGSGPDVDASFFPEKSRRRGNGRNGWSQQEKEGAVPCGGHLSPEKRGSTGGGWLRRRRGREKEG